ncbi:cysteine hydrolase family protein [Halobellus salinisoli]|uniref:cysteine hydrolase family protein n=1 Tax=Halobellus salinisoli TaxID=3108500 RepID=UPI00300A1CE9
MDSESARFDEAYIPDLIPDSDLAYFEKAGFGARIGWGDAVAIVAVDFTRQFSEDGWPLGRSDTADPAIEATAGLLAAAREHGVPRIHVKGLERRDRLEGTETTQLSKSTAPFDPDEGNEIRPAVAPGEGDIVLRKPGRSAFFGTRLDALLRRYGIDTLIVTGLVTSGCIRGTVVDGFERGYRVIVPPECVADRGTVSHEVTLFDLDMKYADVTPVSEVEDRLAAYAP